MQETAASRRIDDEASETSFLLPGLRRERAIKVDAEGEGEKKARAGPKMHF
jgi:hypothetical protein